jgi:uncharacterized membrane protein YobD (UPF0266 family)
VTGFAASSVMNYYDLWVDFETGIVLSTNRNQGIFYAFFWLSYRMIHQQDLLVSVALAKNEKQIECISHKQTKHERTQRPIFRRYRWFELVFFI